MAFPSLPLGFSPAMEAKARASGEQLKRLQVVLNAPMGNELRSVKLWIMVIM